MGHFSVPIRLARASDAPFLELNALVDTGSTYTWIAGNVLERLGIVPEEEWPFELADGREVRYPVAEARVRVLARGRLAEHSTIVVFAPDGTSPILGVYTLEGFRLAADPVNQRLIPVPGLAKTLA